ncbi:MAG TPA: hypothetical protein EYH15_04000 [Methanothermococcus okinawensis]|uniref:TIM-barrel protein n=1 Tax=Methanothermococcus okinawensis TaxID=155863 RepID=A0A832ZKX6_9EURY|nr:hypothetical protein [Methanococcaceae archaeon]HIP84631.1 hypothetical protein [Methanothermococcus okinawensis]HIP91376.1 hypothetical protein [Methanothermococcus okinawensis]
MDLLQRCKGRRVVLAPMAGITDGSFCGKYRDLFGIVTLGALNLDSATLSASKEIVKRGRREFLYSLNKFEYFVKREIVKARESNALVSVNIRFKDFHEGRRRIEFLGEHCDIIELNCHCRQEEIVNLGIGQELLKGENIETLKDFLKGIQELEIGKPILLKVRANVVPVDELIDNLNKVKRYFHGIHLDCFNPGKDYPDMEYLEKIRRCFRDKIVIGNNSINSLSDGERMLKYGDLISVARCLLKGNVKWIAQFNRKTSRELSCSPLENPR